MQILKNRMYTLLTVSLFLFCASISNSVFAQHWNATYPLVGGPVGTPYPYAEDIARDPNDVPSTPLANRGTIEILAKEITTYLAPKDHGADWAGDGTDVKFTFFALGGGQTSVTDYKVPGPFLRVKQGNTVTIKFTNDISSTRTHSIDLHAVLGQKGGGATLMAIPGETKEFTFVAKNPGIYVYHCVGNGKPYGIALHENNGMFGLILVEPTADCLYKQAIGSRSSIKEFYIFEQDIYYSESALLNFDEESMLEGESPDYIVYNGRVGSLVDHPLAAEVGKHAIIYHGAAGQHIPSFHIIGEIFDVVWQEGDLTSDPLRNVQTTLVPSSGAIAVGLMGTDLIPTSTDSDGNFVDLNILVDHALPCFRKGALGLMTVAE